MTISAELLVIACNFVIPFHLFFFFLNKQREELAYGLFPMQKIRTETKGETHISSFDIKFVVNARSKVM